MHETLMYLAMGFGIIVASILLITAIVVVSKRVTYKFGLTRKLQFKLLFGLAIVGVLIYYVTNNTATINNGLSVMTNYIDNNFLNDLSVVLKHLFVSEMEVLMIFISLASGYILYVILDKPNARINKYFGWSFFLVLGAINFEIILQINYYSSRTIGTLVFIVMTAFTLLGLMNIVFFIDDKLEKRIKEANKDA